MAILVPLIIIIIAVVAVKYRAEIKKKLVVCNENTAGEGQELKA